jgi:hypothetical protein
MINKIINKNMNINNLNNSIFYNLNIIKTHNIYIRYINLITFEPIMGSNHILSIYY